MKYTAWIINAAPGKVLVFQLRPNNTAYWLQAHRENTASGETWIGDHVYKSATWSISGNTLCVVLPKRSVCGDVLVNDNRMLLWGGDAWTRLPYDKGL